MALGGLRLPMFVVGAVAWVQQRHGAGPASFGSAPGAQVRVRHDD